MKTYLMVLVAMVVMVLGCETGVNNPTFDNGPLVDVTEGEDTGVEVSVDGTNEDTGTDASVEEVGDIESDIDISTESDENGDVNPDTTEVCTPECDGNTCGDDTDDGCGGTCGCNEGYQCGDEGTCKGCLIDTGRTAEMNSEDPLKVPIYEDFRGFRCHQRVSDNMDCVPYGEFRYLLDSGSKLCASLLKGDGETSGSISTDGFVLDSFVRQQSTGKIFEVPTDKDGKPLICTPSSPADNKYQVKDVSGSFKPMTVTDNNICIKSC